jgi:hypothetical protein
LEFSVPTRLDEPGETLDKGIATVYQDLALAPLSSVTRDGQGPQGSREPALGAGQRHTSGPRRSIGRGQMDLGLEGKSALVTGGTAGIGLAIVRTLAVEGARIAFTYVQSSELAAQLASEIKGHAIRMDVRDLTSVRRAVLEASEHLGGVDVLVNKALAPRHTLGEDPDLPPWQMSLRANLESHFLVTEMIAPVMVERNGDV